MGRSRATCAFSAALAMALLVTAGAAQRTKPDPIPTLAGPIEGPYGRDHIVTIGGRAITYTASWREYPLSQDGKVQATISATAYVRKDVDAAQRSKRPVMFLFNGGPGASSSGVHFSAFGPRLRDRGAPGAPTSYADNPDSPLDEADMVFIDPVGTGFSRILPEGSGKPYWGFKGDAGAVLTLIRNWLKDNQREGAPVVLVGESYGGFRALSMLPELGDLNLAGLVLISPAVDLSYMGGGADFDTGGVFNFSSMAAAAWYHQKVDRRGLTAEQFFEEANRFAGSDYAAALYRGASLTADERTAIAKRMSAYIGLSPEILVEANLRPSVDLFVQKLLADRSEAIVRLDARRASPVKPASDGRSDRPMAANELGLGRTNVSKSADVAAYLRDRAGVPFNRDYVSLTLDVNFSWNWREPTDAAREYYNPMANLPKVLKDKPGLKVLVVGGLYDIAVPIAQVRYAIDHAGIPAGRVDYMIEPAGHTAFSEDRPGFLKRVRTVLAAAR